MLDCPKSLGAEIGKDNIMHCPGLVRYAHLARKFEVYFTTDPALKKHPRI